MGRELSLFADYSQKENRITNYCGLVLKMLYNMNPEAFEEVINNMLNGKQIIVNPSFTQQSKQIESIPDLQIKQSSFNIFFETKTTDWFYEDQIRRHVDGLKVNVSDVNILFLITSEFNSESPDIKYATIIKEANANNIILQFITFEDFLLAIKSILPSVDKSFIYIIDEFEDYLSRNNLLPMWEYTLDVVNCGSTKNEIEGGFYICPDTGGAYSHAKCKYFGAYWNRNVNKLSEIKALVQIKQGGKSAHIKWKVSEIPDNELILVALNNFKTCEKWRQEESQKYDLQMFLLDNIMDLDYKKQSKGGMMCSKKYVNLPPSVKDINDAYNYLNHNIWE